MSFILRSMISRLTTTSSLVKKKREGDVNGVLEKFKSSDGHVLVRASTSVHHFVGFPINFCRKFFIGALVLQVFVFFTIKPRLCKRQREVVCQDLEITSTRPRSYPRRDAFEDLPREGNGQVDVQRKIHVIITGLKRKK